MTFDLRKLLGSFRTLPGSFRKLPGSFRKLLGSFRKLWEASRSFREASGSSWQATLKEKVFAWWSSWQTNLHRHCFGSLAAARFEDSDNLPDPLQNDLEAQRADVEQKYQTQSHRVEVLSGQIKSFKKDIEDYQKRVSDCVCCPYACVTISHKSSVLRASFAGQAERAAVGERGVDEHRDAHRNHHLQTEP